jgi:hypothetical protein
MACAATATPASSAYRRSTLRDVSRRLTFIAIALEIFRDEGVHAIGPGSGQNDEQKQ